jgi:hypothetical protein
MAFPATTSLRDEGLAIPALIRCERSILMGGINDAKWKSRTLRDMFELWPAGIIDLRAGGEAR